MFALFVWFVQLLCNITLKLISVLNKIDTMKNVTKILLSTVIDTSSMRYEYLINSHLK